MFLVCSECKKVLIDGNWIEDWPPINQVKYTLCPKCGGPEETAHGMVYMEKQRQKNPKRNS